MKNRWIFLIVVASIIVLISGTLLVLSQIEKGTFVAKMDIGGVNSFPPRLTVLRDRGLTEETGASFLSKISSGKLSITTPRTLIEGKITIICKDYEREQDWRLESSRYGEGMEKRIIFRGLPRDSNCIVNSYSTSCINSGYAEASDLTRCDGGNLYLRFKTPK